MSRFERWAVWSTSLLTAATGFVYLWMQYALEPAQAWDVVNHPLQPVVLKVHVVVAPLLVFSVGMIALRHVWRHIRSRMATARRTGLATAIVLGPMVLTGYLIQVVTGQGLVEALAWAHIGTGVVYVVGLGMHQVLVRRYLAARRDAGSTERRAA